MLRCRRLPLPVRGLLVLAVMVVSVVRVGEELQRVPAAAALRIDSIDSAADIVLEYSEERRLTLNSRHVPRHALTATLSAIYRDRRDKTMWFAGSGSLRFGEVAEVIEAARSAGVQRVGVITPEIWRRGRSAGPDPASASGPVGRGD